MAPQPPLLRLSSFSNRVFLITRYREREGGVIEALGVKVDVTDQVGAVLAELDRRGLELTERPSEAAGAAPAADHSGSRRLDALERDAPHLIAPIEPRD